MENKYYIKELNLDGTSEELFVQARNGYLDLEQMRAVRDICRNPAEIEKHSVGSNPYATNLAILDYLIQEEEGRKEGAEILWGRVRKDLVDMGHTEEINTGSLTFEFLAESDKILLIITDSDNQMFANQCDPAWFFTVSPDTLNGFARATLFYGAVGA